MKLKYPKFSLFLSILIAINLTCSPVMYAAPTIPTVADYTKAKNLKQFQNLVNVAVTNLQPSITLNVPKATLTQYSEQLKGLIGINSYQITRISKPTTTILTITFDYKQAYKIGQYLKNPNLSSRLNNCDKNLLSLAKSIVAKVTTPNMTPYQKEVALHNYIVNTTSYDYDNLAKNTLPDSAYTAYGVLVNKKAVCEGYSEATKLLLNLAGIECEIVTGSSNTSTAHAWNAVKLDDQWYMLDTTFDDPVSFQNGQRTETLIYDYFNVTNTVLAKDHTWDHSKFPSATATKYNYYVVSGNIVNSYNEFKNYIISKIQDGQSQIVCYVNNYSPTTYDLSFILDYYKGQIKYSAPNTSSGSFTLYLS